MNGMELNEEQRRRLAHELGKFQGLRPLVVGEKGIKEKNRDEEWLKELGIAGECKGEK